jgi:hypothetical protein
MPAKKSNALSEVQIGGTHYKGMVIQPFEYGHANHYDTECFSMMKYVMRHRLKDGVEGLAKAIHIADIKLELTEKWGQSPTAHTSISPAEATRLNGFDAHTRYALKAIHDWATRRKDIPAYQRGDMTDSDHADRVKGALRAVIEGNYPDHGPLGL